MNTLSGSLIFKRKDELWQNAARDTQRGVRVRKVQAGMVEIEDASLQKDLNGLSPQSLDRLSPGRASGTRIMHFYSVEEICDMANKAGLVIASHISLPNGSTAAGVFTYKSGRGIPAAAMFLVKDASAFAES